MHRTVMILIIIMERIFASLAAVTPIAGLRTPFVAVIFALVIPTVELAPTMSASLEIAVGSVMIFVGGGALVEVTFLVALVVEIGLLFILVLAVDFMKAAGLLSPLAIRRSPVTVTFLILLSFLVPSVISGHVAVPFLVGSFSLIMF